MLEVWQLYDVVLYHNCKYAGDERDLGRERSKPLKRDFFYGHAI